MLFGTVAVTMRSDDTGDRGITRNATVVALAVAALLLAGVAGVTLAASAPPSGDEILDDAEQRYDAADSVVGAAEVTVTNETETRAYEVSFAATDDNESRVSVTGDNGTYVAGTNGSVGWVHDEATGLTKVYDESDAEPSEEMEANGEAWARNHSWDDTREALYDWSEENATAERIGTETVAGTEAYVVRVTPADDSEGTVTVWVATDDSTVVRQELTGPNGTVTVDVRETTFNASVADSTFQPPGETAPSVGERVDSFDRLQDTTDATLPAVTDERFSFDQGSVVAYGGETAVVQRYTGAAELTVATTTSDRTLNAADAENATETTVAGTTVSVTETEEGVAVWWSEGDVRHGVIADLDRDAVVEIAAGLIEG